MTSGRSLVAGGVLLLSALLGLAASPLLAGAIFALILLAIGALTLLRWPAAGLILLIPANMVIPISIGTGSQSGLHATIMLIAGLTALWLLDSVVRKRSLPLHRSRTILPLLLLLLSTLISLGSGMLRWFVVQPAPLAAQLGGFGVFVLSVAAFLLAAHQIDSLRWLKRLTWLFVGLSAIYIIGRVTPGLYRPISSFFLWGSTANQYWVWLVALVFGQLLFNHQLSPRLRGALWLLLGATFYAAIGQTYDWTSGWLPPLAVAVTLLALRSWRWALLVGLAGLLMVPIVGAQVMTAEEYSFSTRVDAWLILLRIIRVNPVLGLGPSNYYWYTTLYPIRGYFVEFNSHNQYLDLAAQVGIVGLFLYLWFLWEIGKVAWRLRERVPAGFARGYVYGAFGGLMGVFVSGFLGDWILPFVYNVGLVGLRSSILPWLFLGGLVALDQGIRFQERGEEAEPLPPP